ncbi:MAG: GNAT family N-acetyltransferase, partial [Verrucomicrobiales bacterium]
SVFPKAGEFPGLAVIQDTCKVASGSGLSLEIIHDRDRFLTLEPFWDALLERSAVRTPFMRWDWIRLWLEECEEPVELAVAVARDSEGAPLAIAPLVLGRTGEGWRGRLRQLTFAGCIGRVDSEGVDFIIPSGQEGVLAPVLCKVFRLLGNRWDVVHLPMMHEESVSLPHVIAALDSCALGVVRMNRQASRFIRLPATWEELEQSHGGNWRSNHRRKWRKMQESFGGRPLKGGKDLDGGVAFDALLHLHGKRWTIDESAFLWPGVERFHKRLVEKWLPRGRVVIPLLELDGKPGAVSYIFNDFGKFWFYQSGWNEEYSTISVGKMATAWNVQCAIESGIREFDFLPGEYAYKQEWSNDVRFVEDVEAFQPWSLRAWVFRGLRACKRRMAARAAVKAAE